MFYLLNLMAYSSQMDRRSCCCYWRNKFSKITYYHGNSLCLVFALVIRFLLALGGSTYKTSFGHRGLNHPCGNNKKIEIVRIMVLQLTQFSSKEIVKITHYNLNDNTVAGLEVKNKPIFSVQYHPEAGPTSWFRLFI